MLCFCSRLPLSYSNEMEEVHIDEMKAEEEVDINGACNCTLFYDYYQFRVQMV